MNCVHDEDSKKEMQKIDQRESGRKLKVQKKNSESQQATNEAQSSKTNTNKYGHFHFLKIKQQQKEAEEKTFKQMIIRKYHLCVKTRSSHMRSAFSLFAFSLTLSLSCQCYIISPQRRF
eukprot:TRINITY_DN4998_c0_g1_i6.p1 TRINITY_DN4998_c0_g1~~TRINITY_DN4998_c0_g1_i6.p1  ORF type:complete len:119 (-),score=10.87 TRINITY_DN4998_c0_g1_i6:176-532(-)